MSEKNHKDLMYNNLENMSGGQNTIQVFIEEDDVRRGAFENGESELKAQTQRELIGIRDKDGIHLIVRSREVPGNNGSEDGLKIYLPEEMKPLHFEMRRITGNQIEIDMHFDKALPNKNKLRHLDPKIEHPG